MTLTVSTGTAVRPMNGLTSCGDAAVVSLQDGVHLFAVIDALGHGPDAAKSALRVSTLAHQLASRPLKDVFDACDRVLAGYRGVVMSAVQVRDGSAVFAGIGNVDLVGPPEARRPACVAGVLGQGLRTFREYPLSVVPGDRWVLVSDGVRGRSLPKALDSVRPFPTEKAAKELLTLAGREDDDACVLVMDFEGGTS